MLVLLAYWLKSVPIVPGSGMGVGITYAKKNSLKLFPGVNLEGLKKQATEALAPSILSSENTMYIQVAFANRIEGRSYGDSIDK